MKASEIRKILKLAKQFGVKELTVGGLAVSFYAPKVKKKALKVSSSSSLQDPIDQSHDSTPSVPQAEDVELTSEGLTVEDQLNATYLGTLLRSTQFYDQMLAEKSLQDEGVLSDEETQSVN